VILTDREIQTAIGMKRIVIDPPPVEKAYSSTSVDLTLDPILSIFKKTNPSIRTTIDPSVDNFNAEEVIKALTDNHTIDDSGYTLNRNELVLAYTTEYIDLRNEPKIAARVEGKSSLARLGLSVHITAPTIHAGFEGRVRLEIVNHGHLPILLTKGMRICQLVFEQTLGTPAKAYVGQFLGQKPT
jgi:dCTP deaminase